MSRSWLITGCSSGFGRRLASAAAARGDRVLATARNSEAVFDLVAAFPDLVIAAQLDVTKPDTAAAAVAKAKASFGGIDILVNNAGYGLIGAVEEGAPDEYRPMFEVNVFGLIETTRAALPALREKGGTIVNFSSGAGIAGSAGSGFYNATKFAVEGLSEALAEELRPFGIHVIIVEPGPFRTEFLGRSITVAALEMPEYAGTAGQRRHYRDESDGHQPGDPDKAVAVILRAIDATAPPLHLPLGPIAHTTAEHKLASFRRDLDRWKSVAIATDFEADNEA
ncbi:oxidoreductase [Paraburkholderia sp. J41]|uniref:oxidoreductase n=1 Tax=Paraburkholderia sp. J41 TaxID=2805433 RepID=UPI002AC3710A|nr:oxidoreductase [Paraburkholderia sp. J41]